jgi:3-phosphoshikimate 1-carboxyvinyltransferase
MVIQGLGRGRENGRLTGTHGTSHGDHRVAMSIAMAGLTAVEDTRVDDAGCIETSFPDFHGRLLQLTSQGVEGSKVS